MREKLSAKFHVTTLSYPLVRIALLKDAFSEIFELEAIPLEGQSPLQKDVKEKQKKIEKKNVILSGRGVLFLKL